MLPTEEGETDEPDRKGTAMTPTFADLGVVRAPGADTDRARSLSRGCRVGDPRDPQLWIEKDPR